MCVSVVGWVGGYLPIFLSQSHSNNPSQPTQNARHAVQIVDSAGVLDTQAGSQDGLHINKEGK